jgi:hypothetical protein
MGYTRDANGLEVVCCDSMRGPGCREPIARMDRSGFVYCEPCGQIRKRGEPCRKLRPSELRTLARGEQVKRY